MKVKENMSNLSRKKETIRKSYITVANRKGPEMMKEMQGANDMLDLAVLMNSTQVLSADQLEDRMLTQRQQETLKLLAQGMSNKQIAQQLNISVKTVDAHRASIMTRLRIHNLAGLVKYAIRTGLTSLD